MTSTGGRRPCSTSQEATCWRPRLTAPASGDVAAGREEPPGAPRSPGWPPARGQGQPARGAQAQWPPPHSPSGRKVILVRSSRRAGLEVAPVDGGGAVWAAPASNTPSGARVLAGLRARRSVGGVRQPSVLAGRRAQACGGDQPRARFNIMMRQEWRPLHHTAAVVAATAMKQLQRNIDRGARCFIIPHGTAPKPLRVDIPSLSSHPINTVNGLGVRPPAGGRRRRVSALL